MQTSLIIEAQPSKKMGSEEIVYYAKDKKNRQLLCKFNTKTKTIDEIENIEALNPQQQLELQSYLANMRFVQDKLGYSPRQNMMFRMMLPKDVQALLPSIYEKAKKHCIEYDPTTAMLNAFVTYSQAIDKQLQAKKEKGLFVTLGIHPNHNLENKVINTEKANIYAKEIFKKLVSQDNGISSYNVIMKNIFQKNPTASYEQILMYSEGREKANDWMLSCAIMALANDQELDFTIDNIDDLFNLWIMPLHRLKIASTLEQVLDIYRQYFSTLPHDIKTIEDKIKATLEELP